jgi:hypothetical protein
MASSTESSVRPQVAERGRGWAVWVGRALSGLAVVFLLFDGYGKLAMPRYVMDSFLKLGINPRLSTTVGMLLIVSTVLYAIPRTALLGAVLLTGYLGGAVAIHLRAGSTPFEQFFPVVFAVLLVWGGLSLRERRLRALLPIRLSE